MEIIREKSQSKYTSITTPTISERGYIPTGDGCSFYNPKISHISRLNYINIDNCAMNCDSDPDCKSFSIWDDQGSQKKNGFQSCMLNNVTTAGKLTAGYKCGYGGFYQNGQSYDKPAKQIVTSSNINFYVIRKKN